VLECPILTAVNPWQLSLGDLRQCVGNAVPSLAMLLTPESVVEDRVQPAAHIVFRSALVPAGDRASRQSCTRSSAP
jgi:hypothetical protein